MLPLYYETPPCPGLAVRGASAVFAMPMAGRSFISKIVVAQTGGVASDFVAALFSRAGAGEGDPQSASLQGGGTTPLPDDLFRVTPDLQGTAGLLAYFSESARGGRGFPFLSHDGPGQQWGARLGDARVVYLRITPAVPGNYTFAAVLGAETP